MFVKHLLIDESKKGEPMKKLRVLLPVLAILSIMTAGYAYAEEVNPCEGDIAKFCKNVERGEGRILRCLTLSEEKLTPACEKQLGQIKKAVDEVQKACVDDYAIFCSSLLPGQGRIAACLEKNDKILTTKCRAVLKEVKQKAREIQKQMQKR
jgi:hypothetical protein